MHSISHLPQQHQQQQQQFQQHQEAANGHSQNGGPQQEQANGLVTLEALEPAQPHPQQQQPILSAVVPVVQHIVQQQQQQQQPQLHQLQAPTRANDNNLAPASEHLANLDEQHHHQQQHHHHHQHQHHQEHHQPHEPHLEQQQHHHELGQSARGANGATNSHAHSRQRPHIEGIVADGGGPIVQWLLDNYEIADGESLPRSTVYNHYLAHCRQLQMASVNAASFGKLIRSVFVGLKTRRLGTRGHSKYHYFGVRAKQHVRLDWVRDSTELAERQSGGGGPTCSSAHNESSNQNTSDQASDSDSTGDGLECGKLSAAAAAAQLASTKRLKRHHHNSSHQHHHHHLQHHQIYQEHQYGAPTGHNHHHHHQHHQQSNGDPGEQLGLTNGHAAGVAPESFYCYTTSAANGQPLSNGYAAADGHPAGHKHNGNAADRFVWPLDHYDLAELRQHLGPNWSTLVDDHWPQRADSLVKQLSATAANGATAECGESSPAVLDQRLALLDLFETSYRAHYKRMVELLSELKFTEVEQLWFDFWHPSPSHQQTAAPAATATAAAAATSTVHWAPDLTNSNSATEPHHPSQDHNHNHNHHHHPHHLQQHQIQQIQQPEMSSQPAQPVPTSNYLTFNQLYQLTSQPAIVERVNQIDYCLYAAIESFLVPDMLRQMPRPLGQNIRMFARNIGAWMEQAVKDYAPRFFAEKSKSTEAFGQALRRYTSINHLATASRAIWDKRPVLAQMSIDLSRVDLRDIEQQVALLMSSRVGEHHGEEANSKTDHHNGDNQIENNGRAQAKDGEKGAGGQSRAAGCNMSPSQLLQKFLHLLDDAYPASNWPDWCRQIVESSVSGGSFEEARHFIFRWNFYISIIMKELTLKSAPALGSFQLVRLLFDEYMYYLVVSKLARTENKTIAQLLTRSSSSSDLMMGC